MTAIVTDRHGKLRGAGIETIVRHVYGLNAEIKRGTDPGFEWVTEDGLSAIIVSKLPSRLPRKNKEPKVIYSILDHVTEIEE